MYYVEYLFVRSRLLWYTAILLAMGITYLIFINNPPAGSNVHVNGNDVPVDAVFFGASWFAAVMASILSTTLNRDQSHLAYIWTRPVSRVHVALVYMLIDVAAILVSFGIAFGVAALVFAYPPQNHLISDAQTGAVLARSLAIPLMLYGVVEVATSWNPLRISAAVGIFWGSAWILLILGSVGFPAPITQLLSFVNLFNPLAYFPDIHSHGLNIKIAGDAPQMFPIPFAAQTILAYAIFVLGCIAAIYNWKRMEA